MLDLKLDAPALLKLIETCSKSGVRVLKLGTEIEITFGVNEISPDGFTQAVKEMPPETKAIETESLLRVEEELNKERLENMKLEDPAEFERLLGSGELVDEETHD